MGKLFGTDGVRGIVNKELDVLLAYKIGVAAAYLLTRECGHKAKIMIGKDTRISGDMLEAALSAGICSVGADVVSLGVIPTPAVAYLIKKYSADAGIVISASHNPVEYNGIKIFNAKGYKLSDSMENEIEDILLGGNAYTLRADSTNIGIITPCAEAVDDYVDFLCSTINVKLTGLKIAVDCANGAASVTAPLLFKKLGADVHFINAQPDGKNINKNCGSIHLDGLREYVIREKCDIGAAFDGDADRCLMVDENGEIIDGDKMIAICANHLKNQGRLKNNAAVVTVMSNLGFHKMAKEHGIKVISSKVGDRYVLEEMRKGGYILGGEQSGHIIFLDYNTTGDGQLTALQVLSVMAQMKIKASKLAKIMTCYPQVMVNVAVPNSEKTVCASHPNVVSIIAMVEAELRGEGRVLVRPSGTEALVRVMIEGPDLVKIERYANEIADKIANQYIEH